MIGYWTNFARGSAGLPARTVGRPALAAFTEDGGESSWPTVPSPYVVCVDDQALPPDAQRRMAARIGGQVDEVREVREMHVSHSPFLAEPASCGGHPEVGVTIKVREGWPAAAALSSVTADE